MALFSDEYDFGLGLTIANYDVTRDGRFIMLRRLPGGNSLHVVLNWTEELKRVVAAGGVHYGRRWRFGAWKLSLLAEKRRLPLSQRVSRRQFGDGFST